jgi:hypothetical protein
MLSPCSIFADTSTFSSYNYEELKMLGVITPPKDGFVQNEYKGIKFIATSKRKYTEKELKFFKYFIDRTPSLLIKSAPSAIINADVGLVSKAQASGPYIYFDSSDFDTGGFFSAASFEGVFRGFVHEWVHVYQFREAMLESNLTKVRKRFKKHKRQTYWNYLVKKSKLIASFADVTEWKPIIYKHLDKKNYRLKNSKKAQTSNYGRTDIMEDMAETISLVVIGDLTPLSQQRVDWVIDRLHLKSQGQVLQHTFPYAKIYKPVVLNGTGITGFNETKMREYAKTYPFSDIAHFVSKKKQKAYSKIVSLLEKGFKERGWEKVSSKELHLKNGIKKHLFEYRGKWRDLYVEVISYEDATGYLTKPEETIITVLSGYRM